MKDFCLPTFLVSLALLFSPLLSIGILIAWILGWVMWDRFRPIKKPVVLHPATRPKRPRQV